MLWKTDRKALLVKRADTVVLVPAYDWSWITHSDTVQHGRVTFVGGRVRRSHLELGLHCTHKRHQHISADIQISFSLARQSSRAANAAGRN